MRKTEKPRKSPGEKCWSLCFTSDIIRYRKHSPACWHTTMVDRGSNLEKHRPFSGRFEPCRYFVSDPSTCMYIMGVFNLTHAAQQARVSGSRHFSRLDNQASLETTAFNPCNDASLHMFPCGFCICCTIGAFYGESGTLLQDQRHCFLWSKIHHR